MIKENLFHTRCLVKGTPCSLVIDSGSCTKDEVLCDVLPMHAGDILFGRPWQFDRRVMYDGYLNRYSFVKDDRKTTLVPLSSANVFADQLKLEERKKEFEEKELSEKIEKSQ